VKRLSREQVEGRKEKAARFAETVLGDSERAQEIRDESVEDYASRRKFEITNPTRRAIMPRNPRKTVEDYRAEVADLKDEISDLEQENESLQGQLDQVADIVSPEEDESDEEDENGEGE
jgi:predicted RNase H-like nuclease (RuvC/YqgF family)